MKKLSAILILLLTFAGSGAFAQTAWEIDKAHTKIGFAATHMVVSEVEGNFKDFNGTVTSPSEDFNNAAIEFTANVASIDTDNERRDGHLKTDDFFNAEKFPTITFKGNLVKDGGKYHLKGKLTLRDVTKDVSFDVTYGGSVDTGHGMKAGFKVNGKINRMDYGLKWANKIQSGSYVVGEEIEIKCQIELNKKA
jgi:polyisoprenoid-binding protein YceI